MPGPVMPRPTSGVADVLRRLGINLPMPQSEQEAELARTGGVARGIGDIGGFLKGLVTGPNMSGPVDATDLGGLMSSILPVLAAMRIKAFHGSMQPDIDKFDFGRVTDAPFPNQKRPAFFASDKRISSTYGPHVYEADLDLKHPLDITEVRFRDDPGKEGVFVRTRDASRLPTEGEREEILATLRQQQIPHVESGWGYRKAWETLAKGNEDSMVSRGTLDTFNEDVLGDIFAVFDPKQIRSFTKVQR